MVIARCIKIRSKEQGGKSGRRELAAGWGQSEAERLLLGAQGGLTGKETDTKCGLRSLKRKQEQSWKTTEQLRTGCPEKLWCPIPGGAQGQVGWGPGQPELVGAALPTARVGTT